MKPKTKYLLYGGAAGVGLTIAVILLAAYGSLRGTLGPGQV